MYTNWFVQFGVGDFMWNVIDSVSNVNTQFYMSLCHTVPLINRLIDVTISDVAKLVLDPMKCEEIEQTQIISNDTDSCQSALMNLKQMWWVDSYATDNIEPFNR